MPHIFLTYFLSYSQGDVDDYRNYPTKNISPYCDFFLLLEIFYRYTLEKRSALIIRGKDSRAGCHNGTKTRKLQKFI